MSHPSITCSVCDTPLPEAAERCSVCGAAVGEHEDDEAQRAALATLQEALQRAAAERYRIIALLGRGGMGAVFQAEDLRLGRLVAIKVLRPQLTENRAFVGRFHREARLAARLDHPNIVPIYEVERLGDFHYFVMKYVRGRSLEELLSAGPLPIDQGVSLVWQAACGLGHAHQRGVIHRDVKPSNLMLEEGGRLQITDFGISKAQEAGTQYTSVGQIMGTPRYISPEQAGGEPMDGRSDQYSLAAVAYEAMTGRLPITGTSVHTLLFAHIYHVPAPAHSINPTIPTHVSDTLARALAKQPEDRFATMEEFATALWPERPVEAGSPLLPPAVRQEPVAPPPSVDPASTPEQARGLSRVLVLSGAAVVVAVGIGFGLLGRGLGRETAATPPAAAPADSAEALDTSSTESADTIAAKAESTPPESTAAESLASPPATPPAAVAPPPPAQPVRKRSHPVPRP
ncbi:MAG TPA: serine/threonine-protein kinase, partial [Thermopolyspora sp.]